MRAEPGAEEKPAYWTALMPGKSVFDSTREISTSRGGFGEVGW